MTREPIPRRLPIGFLLIGAYKLITAVLSLALGFGLFRLFQADVRATLEPVVRGLRLDPENALIQPRSPGWRAWTRPAALADRGGHIRVRDPARGRGDRRSSGESGGAAS